LDIDLSNPNRISKYFHLRSLQMASNIMEFSEVAKKYHTPFNFHQPNYIFGIEIEVENITYWKPPEERFYWNLTEDNSLRNHGVEFVSIPLKCQHIPGALTQLASYLQPDAVYSPRTSTHVHMNVRDLTIEEITSLVILYTICENILFQWVGHNRDTNVFCNKLNDTNYIEELILNLINHPSDTVNSWNKYTALNINPIASKGSIEFRHLEGSGNWKRILTWINLLSYLKTAAKEKPFNILATEIEDLNSSSMYFQFLESIFKQDIPTLIGNMPHHLLQDLMEEPISAIKIAIYKHMKDTERRNQPITLNRTETIDFTRYVLEFTNGAVPAPPEAIEERITNAQEAHLRDEIRQMTETIRRQNPTTNLMYGTLRTTEQG
jgi:hypothetical protein